jgi:hypothetical protein
MVRARKSTCLRKQGALSARKHDFISVLQHKDEALICEDLRFVHMAEFTLQRLDLLRSCSKHPVEAQAETIVVS